MGNNMGWSVLDKMTKSFARQALERHDYRAMRPDH
jgi:hypothetical protein